MRTRFSSLVLGGICLTQFSFTKPHHYGNSGSNAYSIVILKSKYELRVYDSTSGDWIVSYPVVFGNKDMGDKMMQGDRRTPEGIFHITYKRKHEKWNSFMMIDYPNKESYEKFKQ